MKTLVGLALGTLLSLGATTAANAAEANVAVPTQGTDESIEVVVLSSKQPAPQAASSASPIYEVVVTGKRAIKTKADRTPPAMVIEVPKLELALSEWPVFRL